MLRGLFQEGIWITSAKIFLGNGLRPWQSIVYSFIKTSCNYLINTIIRTHYSFIRYARHKRAFTARLLALTVTHSARSFLSMTVNAEKLCFFRHSEPFVAKNLWNVEENRFFGLCPQNDKE